MGTFQITEASHDERLILHGMIVDAKVVRDIAAKKEKDLFGSKAANLIARWCTDYYRKHGQAPGATIERIFVRWSESSKADETTVEMIDTILQSMSGVKRETLNAIYILDVAAEHFSKIALNRTLQKAQMFVEANDIDSASELLLSKEWQVSLGSKYRIIHPLDEIECWVRAFEQSRDHVLIHYPGALGKFFGEQLCRDNFIAFQAPEKGRKSWWLMDIAARGIMARWKVLYVIVGDMSERQILHRLGQRLAGRPVEKQEYVVPRKISPAPSEEEIPIVKVDKRSARTRMTEKAVLKAQKSFRNKYLRSRKVKFLKLEALEILSVDEINERLLYLQHTEDWVPDIIVLDYADLLDPPPKERERRHQIDKTWRDLRIMNLHQHCLLVTATQANRVAYDKESQGRKDFSESKTKLAHVSGMIGINQTEEWEKVGLQRLNWVVVRDAPRRPPVWVAGSEHLGNPAMLSCEIGGKSR